MPELRKDPVVGRWVIIARERARRPGNFVDRSDYTDEIGVSSCVFCKEMSISSKETDGLGEVRLTGSKDFPSEFPGKVRRTNKGLYEVIDGFGTDEIVIESRDHVANMADLSLGQITAVIKTYAARIGELAKDPRFKFALAYKNYGPSAGSRNIGHARSHIVATPVLPLHVEEKLIGAKEYYETHQRCIYCDLIGQEKSQGQRIVHETGSFIALIPFAARFLFEVWVFPKEHHSDFHTGVAGKEEDLALMMKTLLQMFDIGLDDPAYNFVLQSAPFHEGRSEGPLWRTVTRDYHWHIELMPRLTRMAGFEKGTGFYICSIPPEDMAEYLRGVAVPGRMQEVL